MKETEAKFHSSSIGIWYRRGKIAAWLIFAIYVAAAFLAVKFIPGCHMLETPGVRGCNFAGYNFDAPITLLAFFNIGLVLGLAAALGIIKYLLILWVAVTNGHQNVQT